MNKKILGIALMLPVLCLTLAFISGAGKLSAAAAGDPSGELLTMVEGASIRIAENNGIRFMAKVNDENALKETQEYGMYFCPTAILKKKCGGGFPSGSEIGNLSVPSTENPTSGKPIVRCVMGGVAAGKDDIDTVKDIGKALLYSIVNIKDSHIDREFSAMAFWKDAEVEHFTAQTSRSISYVARKAKKEKDPVMDNDGAESFVNNILRDSNDVLFTGTDAKVDSDVTHNGGFTRKIEDISSTASVQLKTDNNSKYNKDADMLAFYAKAQNTGVKINGRDVPTGDFKKIVIKNPVISAEGTISLTLAGTGALWLDDVKLGKCVIDADKDKDNITDYLDDVNFGGYTADPTSNGVTYNGDGDDAHSVCLTMPSGQAGVGLRIKREADIGRYGSIELSVYHVCGGGISCELYDQNNKIYPLASGAWTDVSIPLNDAVTANGIQFKFIPSGSTTSGIDFYISSIYCTGYTNDNDNYKTETEGELLLDFETPGNVAKVAPVYGNEPSYSVDKKTFNDKKIIELTIRGGDIEDYRGDYYKFKNTNINIAGKEALEFYIYNPSDSQCLFSFDGLCGHSHEELNLPAGEWTKIRVTIGTATNLDDGNFALYLPKNDSHIYPRTGFYMSPVYLIAGEGQGGDEPGGDEPVGEEIILDFDTQGNDAKVYDVYGNGTTPYSTDVKLYDGKKTLCVSTPNNSQCNYFAFKNTGIDISGKESIVLYVYNQTADAGTFILDDICGHKSEEISIASGEWTKIVFTTNNATTLDGGKIGIYLKKADTYTATDFYISPIYAIAGEAGGGN